MLAFLSGLGVFQIKAPTEVPPKAGPDQRIQNTLMGTNDGRKHLDPFFFALPGVQGLPHAHTLRSENAQSRSETCMGARLWYC